MFIFGKLLILPFVLLAAVIWAIVGLFFWIPLLAKSITIFTIALLSDAIIDRPSSHTGKGLEKSIMYYVVGFQIILQVLIAEKDSYNEDNIESNSINIFDSLWSTIPKLLSMVLFASIFWAMLFIFLSHFKYIESDIFMILKEYITAVYDLYLYPLFERIR